MVQTHVLPGKLVQARRVNSSLNQLGSGWFINSLTRQACTCLGKCTTSHLVPHLGAVAASIGTFSRAGVYTLARAPVLCDHGESAHFLQCIMVHPNVGDMCVKRDMVKQFEDQVYEGTLSQEFHDAIVYCQHIVGRYGDGAIGHHMSQGIGQGHPCAIPEEPNAKAVGFQWDQLDVGLAPSCAAGGKWILQ